MKTILAIVGGLCTGGILFVAGGFTYKHNEEFKAIIDYADDPIGYHENNN